MQDSANAGRRRRLKGSGRLFFERLVTLLADVSPVKGKLSLVVEANLLWLVGEVRVADAAMPAQWWDGLHFHRVLRDAPCTGSDVLERHPGCWHRRWIATGLHRLKIEAVESSGANPWTQPMPASTNAR